MRCQESSRSRACWVKGQSKMVKWLRVPGTCLLGLSVVRWVTPLASSSREQWSVVVSGQSKLLRFLRCEGGPWPDGQPSVHDVGSRTASLARSPFYHLLKWRGSDEHTQHCKQLYVVAFSGPNLTANFPREKTPNCVFTSSPAAPEENISIYWWMEQVFKVLEISCETERPMTVNNKISQDRTPDDRQQQNIPGQNAR
ncbi:hypothetical protein RRG08_066712 [Elysia crispata]|uniref:Uncharacterized protein n=1 Tax=Elysia crispata TaxID=231223 RepID=A0AAE1BAA6_9GAST|nr:hypothetical protein RRG08_066712 [Elysia crispata]